MLHLVLVSLLGCGPPPELEEIDADGDGDEPGTDCDDSDAAVHPGAPEVCDGRDEDCDGVVDDDALDVSTFFEDEDGDGYGDPALAAQGCEPDEGYVADGADCDDADPAIHPGADESDCTDPTDYDCDGSVAYADADGDGSPACEDCDDEDPGRSPDRAEVCDDADTDEDCDGVADDDDVPADPSTWWPDADADGYGDPSAAPLVACDPPEGFVADATDCDDADSGSDPGADEACDAAHADEDCDGLSDDDDPSVADPSRSTWYPDLDGDGYGDPAAPVRRCDAPDGYVADASDCDDGNAAINPGATEVCDPADVDEDCDGAADDADSSATDTVDCHPDADGDGFGDQAGTAIARCDPPAGHVTDATDCDDTSASVNPSEPEVCRNAADDDCDGATDERCGISGTFADGDADAAVYDDASLGYFGVAIGGGFDFTGDGVDDLVVGAPRHATYGAVYVFEGQAWSGVYSAPAVDHVSLVGTRSDTLVGSEVWGLPDLDGDGIDDMVVSTDSTQMHVVLGPYSTSGSTIATADAAGTGCYEVASAGYSGTSGDRGWICGEVDYDSSRGYAQVYDGASIVPIATMLGESTGDWAGYGVSGGADADGDGYDDYFVGAPYNVTGGVASGAAYVVYAPVSPSSTFSLSGADVKMRGAHAGDAFGIDLLTRGDMSGDGYADLVVDAWMEPTNGADAGAVYLFESPYAASLTTADAVATFYGPAGNYLGGLSAGALSVGDVDGDGEPDLLVTSGQNSDIAYWGGKAWLFYGPLSGSYDLSDPTAGDARFEGSEALGQFAIAATIESDLDADGFDDVVLGAPAADDGGYADYGAIYVFYGI